MEYTNSQIRELIREHIHNEEYGKWVYCRLVKGWTFERIAGYFRTTEKTVRKHIRECEEILFRHLPE